MAGFVFAGDPHGEGYGEATRLERFDPPLSLEYGSTEQDVELVCGPSRFHLERLMARLAIAVRGVSTRSAIQTLSGVLLQAEEGAGIALHATDMELGVRIQIESSVERSGRVVLPGRLLLDVVRSLPRDRVEPVPSLRCRPPPCWPYRPLAGPRARR